MPNKAHLRLWVAALRSGIYKQGKMFMRQGSQHCCLGVAMEVALRAGHKPAGAIEWGQHSVLERSIHEEFYGFEWMTGTRNIRVTTDMPLITMTSLADLNDKYNWNFNEIADAIEKEFDLLTYDEIFDPEFVPSDEAVAT